MKRTFKNLIGCIINIRKLLFSQKCFCCSILLVKQSIFDQVFEQNLRKKQEKEFHSKMIAEIQKKKKTKPVRNIVLQYLVC